MCSVKRVWNALAQQWWLVRYFPDQDMSDSDIREREAAGLRVLSQRFLHFADGEAWWRVSWEPLCCPE